MDIKLKSILLIIIFFLYTIFIPSSNILLALICSIVLIGLTIYLFKKELKKELKQFTKHLWRNIGVILLLFLIIIILQGVSGSIIQNIYRITSPNSISQISLLKEAPLYLLFSMLIFSPLVEEVTFRYAFQKIIDNKILYCIICSFVYALIYIAFGSTASLIFIIPTILVALVYALALLKTKNVFIPIFLHLFQNTFAIICYFISLNQ